MPGPIGSLRGGWRLLTDDPFAVLLPTAGLLLVDALLGVAVRAAAPTPAHLLAGAVLAAVVRPYLHVPFLARLVAVSARLAGRDPWPWGRPVALLGAELVVGPLVALAFAAPTAIGAAAASLATNEGWLASGAALLAVGALVGSALALAVRAVAARVPWEVAVEGRSSVGALVAAVRAAPAHAPAAAILLLGSDLLLGASALACGALVLPGYPLYWLALAFRWAAEPVAAPARGEPPRDPAVPSEAEYS